jgi:hypothetical protein
VNAEAVNAHGDQHDSSLPLPLPLPLAQPLPQPRPAVGPGQPDDRLERFLDLSVALTGFERFSLLGTGLSASYLHELEAIVPAGVVDDLLRATTQQPEGRDLETQLEEVIFADPRLGPVARNLIIMWYCGGWTPMPDDWRAVYGASPLDTRHMVSADAYRAGLQWVAAGAHAAGANQQGYGAWALPPDDVTSGTLASLLAPSMESSPA